MFTETTVERTPTSRWTLGVSSTRTIYPIFSWGLGELQNGDSPLWASAMRLAFFWEWPEQEIVHCNDADTALAQIAARGFSVPPLIYEVENDLRLYRPKMLDKTFEERIEMFAEMECHWRELIRGL